MISRLITREHQRCVGYLWIACSQLLSNLWCQGQHEEEKVEEAEELEDFLQELEGRLQTGEAGNGEGDEHMTDDVENQETGSAMITTE